jgi:hypothetical protein
MTENLDDLRKALAEFEKAWRIPHGNVLYEDNPVAGAARAYLALMQGAREVDWCVVHNSLRADDKGCESWWLHVHSVWSGNPKSYSVPPCRMVPAKLFIPGRE